MSSGLPLNMTTAAEISDDSLRQLRLLLAQLQVNPALLHTDTRLEFFKTYLTTMGAAIPEPPDLNISDEARLSDLVSSSFGIESSSINTVCSHMPLIKF